MTRSNTLKGQDGLLLYVTGPGCRAPVPSIIQANHLRSARIIGLLGNARANGAEPLDTFLTCSDRPLIVTSGTGISNTMPGQSASEYGATIISDIMPRAASEEAAIAVAEKGINVSVVRLPQVHDTKRRVCSLSRLRWPWKWGDCVYIGDGRNRWPTVHISDATRLYLLVIEKAAPSSRYHAVAEEGVPMRDIMDLIGRRLGLPVRSINRDEAESYLVWLAHFAHHDAPASSEQTQIALV